MNPKLIIASLTGVGLLGGGVTSCYYYCGQKASEKQKSTTSSEGSTLDTSKNQETDPQTQNKESVPASAPEGRPQVSAEQGQPLQNQVADRGAQVSPDPVLPRAG